MNTNRSTTHAACSKKFKAAKAFGQDGSMAAGATGFGLDVLGVCVPIPQPLRFGLSAIMGMLFGCIAGCSEYKKEDTDVRQDHELFEIRRELGEVQRERMQEEKRGRGNSYFLFNRENGQFSEFYQIDLSFEPADMKIEPDDLRTRTESKEMPNGPVPELLERKSSIRL